MSSLIDFGAPYDPAQQRGMTGDQFVTRMADLAAKRQAGRQYAAGDFAGAMNTLASRGDWQNAQALRGIGAGYQAAEALQRGDYAGAARAYAAAGQPAEALKFSEAGTKDREAKQEIAQRAIPYLRHAIADGHDPGETFDLLNNGLKAAGYSDAEITQARAAYTKNPSRYVDALAAMVKPDYKDVPAGGSIIDLNNPAAGALYASAPAAGKTPAEAWLAQWTKENPGATAAQQAQAIANFNRQTTTREGPEPIIRATGDGGFAVFNRGDLTHPQIIPGPDAGLNQPSAMDPESKSILAQTGLSIPAYLVLTGSASALPRDRVTRDRAFREAQDFANQRGVDVSTLASQFKANNEVLQQNIARVNATATMEDELEGTLDNLQPVADAAGQGRLRVTNLAKLWAGQEFNDPVVQQYAFQLNQLRSELAAYNGALQGRGGNSLNLADYQEAERVIKDGLSSKGAEGLRTGVKAATEKMSAVLNRSVDRARQGVWNVFGVGDKYKPAAPPRAQTGGKPKYVIEKVE